MSDRSWIWQRFDKNGYIRAEFEDGVKKFLDFAYSQSNVDDHDKIRCPCSKCCKRKFNFRDDVHYHIKKNGFKSGYTTWDAHGEPWRTHQPSESRVENDSRMSTMVIDAA